MAMFWPLFPHAPIAADSRRSPLEGDALLALIAWTQIFRAQGFRAQSFRLLSRVDLRFSCAYLLGLPLQEIRWWSDGLAFCTSAR